MMGNLIMKYFYIFLFFPFILSAQSEFILDSNFGIKTDFVLSMNNNFSAVGGDIGISLFGRFDFGLEYISGSNDDANYSIESSGTLIYTAYNFKLNSLSLKILAGYIQNSVNIKDFVFTHYDATGPLLSVVLSYKIYENDFFFLLPNLGFSMSILSSSEEEAYSFFTEPGDNIDLGLEFNIVPKLSKRFYLVVSPAISGSIANSRASAVYSIGFGAIYNIPKQD
jgi:hypothetical protein